MHYILYTLCCSSVVNSLLYIALEIGERLSEYTKDK